jgi:hypothetical protein
VALLEQPAEVPIAIERGELVPGAAVDERRGDDAPPLGRRRPGHRDVGARDDRQQQVAEQRQEDQRQRRPRARVDAERTSPRGRRGARGGAARLLLLGLRLGDRPVALDLRRALAQARAAVRALRDVRADLGTAVLADDEEVRELAIYRR